MKRGLRFRIWNKQEKKYLENVESFLVDLVSNNNGTTVEYKADDTFVLEQSTELQTNEGKEIFEGDVLEFIWGGSKKLAQVRYKYGAYIAELLNAEGTLSFHTLHAMIRFDCPINILGNINQNPEYLEKKNT